jgi:DeoR/GlpR family transcriptional regulator of sugar metabolism
MIVQERHGAILRVLSRKPRLDLLRLQREVGVSRSTLRRDLLELEHLGEVVRLRGSVVQADFYKGEATFERRRGRCVEEKRSIATLAVGLVEANASIYIDAGTTCLEVGRLLLKRADLHLFTHSIRLVADSVDANASIVCVGGEYRRISGAVVGGLTAHWLGQLRFDVAFVAASGMDGEGCTTTEMTETQVKQEVLRRSARRILVADSQKWNHPSTIRFDDWSKIDEWVTDAGLPAAVRRIVRDKGIRLHIAS